MSQFKDYFSDRPAEYSQYRPTYPTALFDYLASMTKRQDVAWDCATGSGQAALMLAVHFSEVIATDASAKQIANAMPNLGVTYRVASAEKSGFADGSLDLITVAQALHWFDLDAFGCEASRVLRPGGLLAAWSYAVLTVHEPVDAVMAHLYGPVLGAYWPKERKILEAKYRDVQMPLKEIKVPKIVMTAEWDLPHLLGYLETWSATKRYQAENGLNPIAELNEEFVQAWGEPTQRRLVSWPLALRVWCK